MPSYSGVFTLQAQMQAIAANNWPSPPLQIGQAFGGGFFAGQISTVTPNVASYNLVIGPKATAQSTLQWKIVNTSGDANSVIDGPTNSLAMNSATYPAAQFCEGRSIGGFTDWYMPATNELEVCYFNLKPTTTSNDTSYGINPNAVPARASNYTAGTPAQTSATSFQTGNSEAFDSNGYWSSTEDSNPVRGQRIYFPNGILYSANKTNSGYVRAIRRVAV